jgi:ankyrin repeat protein
MRSAQFSRSLDSSDRKTIVQQLKNKYLTKHPKCTPFISACEQGSVNDVKLFIQHEGGDVKYINQTGRNSKGVPHWSGLLIACIYEQYGIVEYLLKQPLIDISIVYTRNGNNAFHFVALWATDTNILELLLSHSTCSSKIINCQNNNKKTALDCVNDNPNFVKKAMYNILLKHNAKTGACVDKERYWEIEEGNKRAKYFQTKNVEKAKHVLSQLNKKYLKCFPAGTPFVVACEKGNLKDVKQFVRCFNIIDYQLNVNDNRTKVLKKTININQVGKTSYAGYAGKSGLIAACGSEHTAVVKFLLKCKSPPYYHIYPIRSFP